MTATPWNPRVEAVRILVSVMEGAERSTDALNRAENACPDDQRRDAALVHELVLGVLRRRMALWEVVSGLVRRPLEDTHPAVRELLLTLAYQALFLTRIPAHARVSESVEVARRLAGDRAAAFVNAVGRGLERRLAAGDPVASMAPEVRWSVPPHARTRIARLLGHAPADADLAPLADHAPVAMRVNRARMTRDDALALLASEQVRARPTRHSAEGIVIEEGASATLGRHVPALLVPQDEASQLVVPALAPRAGESVLDLCAGVGMKTMQLLAEAGDGVTAVDLDAAKLDCTSALARTMGLPAPKTLRHDATALPSSMDGTFDAVLLDAPCTGIGTLVRRPEVRYTRRESDFARAARLQSTMIARAAALVRPGGRLVYAVCSFAPEEGEDVVARLLAARGDLALEPVPFDGPFVRSDGTMLTLPWRDDMDGFYVARIRRS